MDNVPEQSTGFADLAWPGDTPMATSSETLGGHHDHDVDTLTADMQITNISRVDNDLDALAADMRNTLISRVQSYTHSALYLSNSNAPSAPPQRNTEAKTNQARDTHIARERSMSRTYFQR